MWYKSENNFDSFVFRLFVNVFVLRIKNKSEWKEKFCFYTDQKFSLTLNSIPNYNLNRGSRRVKCPPSPPKRFSYLRKNFSWCLGCPPSTTYQGANCFQDDRNSRLMDSWFSFYHCFKCSVITRSKENRKLKVEDDAIIVSFFSKTYRLTKFENASFNCDNKLWKPSDFKSVLSFLGNLCRLERDLWAYGYTFN
jgi:hypothetical protein